MTGRLSSSAIERYGAAALARVIWLTVGTSAVISRDSPAENSKVCAPIATRTRLTLYWYLRKIAGPGLTLVYNLANALLYCILAGAMILGLLAQVPTQGRLVAWIEEQLGLIEQERLFG